MIKSLKILIAPLDWGLGHTTRCMPLIHYLQAQGHEVIAAAEGTAALLLRANFPALTILPLQGYRIQYARHKSLFTARILSQVPRLFRSIRKEHAWLKQMHSMHHFDAVISDNRYGCYLPHVPSVLLTHQLQILSGKGKWVDRLLRQWHYKQISRFRYCWVVDIPEADGLSGKLAHPDQLPSNAQYIGWLSQLTIGRPAVQETGRTAYQLILLSGPEPMRGQLETLLLQQLRDLPEGRFVFVAGNPVAKPPDALPDHIDYRTHLSSRQLKPIIANAELVICRSGYTSLMDIALMGKRALLIPTPGQTEQEYLAGYLAEKQQALVRQQDEVVLHRDIPLALAGRPIGSGMHGTKELLAPVVSAWLRQLDPG